MNQVLFAISEKEPLNFEFNKYNLKQGYMRMEKSLHEATSRLKESEENRQALIKKNSYLVDDNRNLYEKLLNAEKGRILAEKECCELLQEMKTLAVTQDADIQVVSKDLYRNDSDSTTSTTDLVSDPCENCGTEKVITCVPADVLFITRKDLSDLDADMTLLKDILTKKVKLYDEVIEKKGSIQEAIEELNNEIQNLRNLNRWKDIALDQKEHDIVELKKTIRELNKKLLHKNDNADTREKRIITGIADTSNLKRKDDVSIKKQNNVTKFISPIKKQYPIIANQLQKKTSKLKEHHQATIKKQSELQKKETQTTKCESQIINKDSIKQKSSKVPKLSSVEEEDNDVRMKNTLSEFNTTSKNHMLQELPEIREVNSQLEFDD